MHWRVLSAAITITLVSGAVAQAAATRAEYVSQVDPICETGQKDMKAESKKQNPGIKKIAARLQQEELSRKQENALLGKLAVKEFAPTLKVFPRVTTQITAVAPAPTDTTVVSQWLASRRTYSDLIARAIQAAKQGNTKRENFLIEKATGKLVEGEIPVETYGFKFCLLSSPQD